MSAGFKVGDTVRAAGNSNFWTDGDTGIVRKIEKDGDLWVFWENPKRPQIDNEGWCIQPQQALLVHRPDTNELPTNGLTKRELFAAMAMQGFAADPKVVAPAADVAQIAVKWADALIAELEKGA